MGKMLIIADMKNSCIATKRGLQLAKKLGHSVEIVAFTYAPLDRVKMSKEEKETTRKRLLEVREQDVQERIDKFQKPGQQVSLEVVWGEDIHHWVIERCQAPYEMVVKTGRRTESFTYTSTDWQLLRECPAPILLVAAKKWHKTKPVLATLDLRSMQKDKMQLNHQVIARAKQLAESLEAELKLICAIEIPTLMADLDLVDPLSYTKDAIEAMQPAIKELSAAFDLPTKAFKVKRGPVEKVITSAAAKHRAQLVVMGTVGRKGMKARLIGNTAEKVLLRLKTDVLTLKLAV